MAAAVSAVLTSQDGGRNDASRKNGESDGQVVSGCRWLAIIETAFKAVDMENFGVLTQMQMQQLWAIIFPKLNKQDICKVADDIYQDLDPNGDGIVSWPELEAYFAGSTSAASDVDKMLSDTVEEGRPTCRQLTWVCVEIDAPMYTELPAWAGCVRKVVSMVSNITIFVSILNFIVESGGPDGEPDYSSPGFIVEATCIAIFTVEFFFRLVSCPSQHQYWTSFYTWVDTLAILPFYIGVVLPSNPSGALVVLRVLRLLRLLRMLKLGRQFEAVQVLIIAVSRTIYPLIISMIGVNTIAVTLFASVITTAERTKAEYKCFTGVSWCADCLPSQNVENYEEYFKHNCTDPYKGKWVWSDTNDLHGRVVNEPLALGQSIGDSMWWAWVTLTTVGYGDMYPKTPPGKAVAAVTMVCGLVLMAFPLTLLASSFAETSEELRQKKLAKQRNHNFVIRLREDGMDPQASEAEIEQAVMSVMQSSGAMAFYSSPAANLVSPGETGLAAKCPALIPEADEQQNDPNTANTNTALSPPSGSAEIRKAGQYSVAKDGPFGNSASDNNPASREFVPAAGTSPNPGDAPNSKNKRTNSGSALLVQAVSPSAPLRFTDVDSGVISENGGPAVDSDLNPTPPTVAFGSGQLSTAQGQREATLPTSGKLSSWRRQSDPLAARSTSPLQKAKISRGLSLGALDTPHDANIIMGRAFEHRLKQTERMMVQMCGMMGQLANQLHRVETVGRLNQKALAALLQHNGLPPIQPPASPRTGGPDNPLPAPK